MISTFNELNELNSYTSNNHYHYILYEVDDIGEDPASDLVVIIYSSYSSTIPNIV